jgi:hypothetical protein
VHLVKVSELDVGRPYSFMVTRLLACHQSVVLGLRRQRGVRPGVGMRRSSTTVEWRSLIGLGAEARQAEAEMGGTYKPKEVCPQAGFADFTSSGCFVSMVQCPPENVTYLRATSAIFGWCAFACPAMLQASDEPPYVVVCPPMDTRLRHDDYVFVLSQNTPYGAWAQTLL